MKPWGAALVALLLWSAPTLSSESTLERTAINALRDLSRLPSADLWEYSGFIVNRGGAIYYTMFPYTDKSKDSVSSFGKDKMIPGDILVGIYHNHPCFGSTHFTDVLSLPDLITAKFNEVPTFVLDNCTGLVHTFDWSRDKIQDSGVRKHVHLPASAQTGPNGKDVWMTLPTGRIIGSIGRKFPNLDKPFVQLSPSKAM